MRIYKQILLIILAFNFLFTVKSQPTCANSYTQSNLPSQCSSLNKTCSFISFANSSLIVANTTSINQTFLVCLNMPSYQINLSGGSDNFQYSFYINSLNIDISDYSMYSTGDAILISSNSIVVNQTNITSSLIWMQSQTVNITNSNLKYQQLFETTCNCLQKGAICTLNPYYFPFLYSSISNPSSFNMGLMNYTYDTWNFLGNNVNSIVITANTTINIQYSILRISVIAIYSPSINIYNSTLNTTGLGFPSGTGYGCGYFNQLLNQLLGCTGTGGSYGGYGGNSSPQGCNLLFSNPPYSRQLIPKYPGSGGGFFLREATEVSSGGGVINIQVVDLLIQYSQIIANGVGGIQGGAGGSGGSISVDYTSIATVGTSKMSANGGSGRSSGSGGRIRIWDQNWKSYQSISQSNMIIQVLGGISCDSRLTCGQNGSVISSPCPPGYSTNFYTFACQSCPTGSYQLSYGYGKCYQCYSKPPNSQYLPITNTNDFSNYSIVCNFQCNPDHTQYNNKQCLSNFETILVNVGGINLLICIGIIISSLIIFLIITMIRKLSYSDNNNNNDNKHVQYYKKKSYFKIQDIPFHQIRIYFQGENTPRKPWKISDNIKDNLKQFYQFNQNKMLIFNRLIKQLNQISQYHKGSSIILFILKIFYYPLSLVLAQAFRQRKSKNIRDVVIAKSKNLQSNIGIKFHVNSLYTVGCLQIFNYNKQILDFYIRNYFPMYFKLQRLLIGGYSIDSSDPLLKALFSQFQDRNQNKLQKFLIQLNHLLRNQDITVYKHLWKISQIWPALQCYLWQPPTISQSQNSHTSLQQIQLSGIMGMQDRLIINKNKDLFLVFSIEGKPQQSISSLINRSSIEQNRQIQPYKYSKHFFYNVDLPNIYFDEISCIRYKYNLRQTMIQIQQKKNVFWEIQSNFSQKTLSWILGIISILSFLLNLFSFFLIVFLLVQYKQTNYIYSLLVYFILFPLCQFFMIFIQFNLIVSKGTKIMSYSIYFTLFTIIKNIIITIILIIIAVTLGFSDVVILILFLIWLALLIFNIASLIFLCLLNSKLIKAK